jgi:hypothetical protein
MNSHLDARRDRVATRFRSSGYLEIPWVNLGLDFQVEISEREFENPDTLRAALKRHGITHPFIRRDELERFDPWLDLVFADSTSRLAGTRFFGPTPTEDVAVFALR